MPYVSAIYLYPIKSLDPVMVREATVLESGALDFDREFALVDAQGHFVNGKRNPKVHLLRAHIFPETGMVSFQAPGRDEMRVFNLEEEKPDAEAWLSEYFGESVTLKQRAEGGFPDDTDANGPTLIGRETLREVVEWFGGRHNEENIRLRFRANIELGGALPFWEDRLVPEPGHVVRFQVGNVRMEGLKPCQRCIVPTRDPLTGEQDREFQKTFTEQREAKLPPFAPKARFDHYYRLAVNTRIPRWEAGKQIKVGARVRLVDIVPLEQARDEAEKNKGS